VPRLLLFQVALATEEEEDEEGREEDEEEEGTSSSSTKTQGPSLHTRQSQATGGDNTVVVAPKSPACPSENLSSLSALIIEEVVLERSVCKLN